jgi:hypothetical protein
MSTQPEALRLADELEQSPGYDFNKMYCESAAELRRLYSVNADLSQALKDATNAIEHWGSYSSDYFQQKWDLQSDINAARAAIARAEGKS